MTDAKAIEDELDGPSGRDGVLAALDELVALSDGLLGDAARRHLEAARLRVAEDRFNLVVLGEFKRGKSTLINALLGRELLPTGVVPLTSVVTVIAHGPHGRLMVRFLDGREEERPRAELAEYVTEAANPANRRGVELARLEVDDELLAAGLELVDTPGIGSIHAHNTETARSFLPRVDATLYVLDGGQPLSEPERELLLEAAQRVPHLIIVVNKIDQLGGEDRDIAVEFIRSAVRGLVAGEQVELFAVSARHGDGIAALRQRLHKLAAAGEREPLLVRSVAGLSGGVAAETAQAARFEANAITLPLDELRRRGELFEQRIAELRVASGEAGDLLEQGVRRALDGLVNEPLQGYARAEHDRLRAALHAHVEALGRRAPRQLSAELERWIDATVRREFAELVPRVEAAVAQELGDLQGRYAERVERILQDVQGVAEDVFGSRAADVLPQTGLREPSRFTFKLKDAEHALDMLVGLGRTATPGALGRRLVVRDAEQRLVAMTDRHAGRLRSELAERVRAAARGYQRELAAAVDDAIAAIRSAIARAVEEQRRGEASASHRLDELAQAAARCERLVARFGELAGGAPATNGGGP